MFGTAIVGTARLPYLITNAHPTEPQVLQVFLHKEKDKLSKKSAISHA
jgi:hypothetical protein